MIEFFLPFVNSKIFIFLVIAGLHFFNFQILWFKFRNGLFWLFQQLNSSYILINHFRKIHRRKGLIHYLLFQFFHHLSVLLFYLFLLYRIGKIQIRRLMTLLVLCILSGEDTYFCGFLIKLSKILNSFLFFKTKLTAILCLILHWSIIYALNGLTILIECFLIGINLHYDIFQFLLRFPQIVNFININFFLN